MKTIYLHIGTHKTGSTSIQRFLARADQSLADQGILYPEAGRPDTGWSDRYGHHKLYWSLVGKRGIENEQVWSKLSQEIDAFEGQSVVLSAEGFDGIGVKSIQRTLEHLRSHSVRIVVYLRPPLQFLTSAYTQRVKMGTYSGPFAQFTKEQIPNCNYLDLVNRWQQFSEVESVDILLFDKAKRDPGLEASFAKTVGIDFEKTRPFAGPPVNTSPSQSLVQVTRWINKIASMGPENESWKALMSRVRGNVLGKRWPGRWIFRFARPFLRDSLATEQAADMLRDELEETHHRFLERYVPPEDRCHLEL